MSRQDFMYRHVQQWKQSNLTQQAYCLKEHLKLPSFSYWVQKHNKQQKLDTHSDFITLSKPTSFQSSYEIVYPNGVILRVNSKDLSELSTLLKLL